MADLEHVFTSEFPWLGDRIRALAMYCSDGRYGDQMDQFLHEHLGLPRYDRFAVPGGCAWLVLRDTDMLRAYDVARDQLQFLVTAHRLERIVLVAHHGCAFYGERFHADPDACLPHQLEDLRDAANVLRAWFAGIQVDLYLAHRHGEQISFHLVPDR